MLNSSPIHQLIHSQARVYGNKTAMRYRDYDDNQWKDISWNTFSQRVMLVSNAMLELGVQEQENMAVFSQNMPEGMYVDFGAYAIRSVTIPFYATSSEMQVKYMVSDANIRYIFVGEQEQYDIAFRVQKLGSSIEKLIIFDPKVRKNSEDNINIYFQDFILMGQGFPHMDELNARSQKVQPDDLANILYTSGTTGLSKGVMLTHRMYNTAISNHQGALNLSENDVVLCFLPFTHVFERGWSYLCLASGATLCVNLRPQDVLKSLQEVHPTCMCSVPRFWEKVYSGVMEKINNSGTVQKNLMLDALKVGNLYNVKYRLRGLVPPLGLKMKWAFYQKTVISLLLKQLGLENHNFFPTAGAAIPRQVEEFIHSCGIMMIAGYGLTESTATVTCDRWNQPVTIGSVGRLLKGIEIKFGEDNEVLLRGDSITKGYYRKAEVTQLSIDAEGWFHTGDAGYMKDGELFLTDRIKDLFKTSNGKYIAPQLIESKLSVDRYIDQIVVIADQKKFVSALVIPEYHLLEEFAHQYNIPYTSIEDLCANPKINEFLMYRIDTLQQEFAHYEQVKKIVLLPQPFSLEKGELTNTLKVRRPILMQNYHDQIEAMYNS